MIFCFSSKSCPLILALIAGCNDCHRGVLRVILNSCILYILKLEFFCKIELSLLHLSQCEKLNTDFTLWIILLFIFFSQVVPVLTISSSFRLAGTCVLPTYLLSRLRNFLASWVAQMVKNLPAMQETQVQYLGQDDPPEKGKDIHSSILAWRIPWTEEPGRL